MTASTVPAAKQAILDLLVAVPALNEVAITWGEPTEQEDLQAEMMFFDGPVIRQPEWRYLGGDYLDETYTLTLRIENYLPGDDRAAAEARTWELINEVEQVLRANDTLGGLLSPYTEGQALEFGEQQVGSLQHSDGWRGAGVMPLVCHARV